MLERRRGALSRFKSYIDTLDPFPSVPCHGTTSCPGYPALQEAAKARKKERANHFNLLTEGVHAGGKILTREEFDWSMGVVKSRAFSPSNNVKGARSRLDQSTGPWKRTALELLNLAYGCVPPLPGAMMMMMMPTGLHPLASAQVV